MLLVLTAGLSTGGIWLIIGMVATIAIFIFGVSWYSNVHNKGELEEWKRLAANPDYEPSFSEVVHEISGKNKEQIRRLAKKRIRELSEK